MTPEMRLKADAYYRALRRYHPDPRVVRLETRPLHLSHQVGTGERLSGSVGGPVLARHWVHLPCGTVEFSRLKALEDDLPRALYYRGPEGIFHPIFWARVAPKPPGPGSLPMSLLQRKGETFRSPVLRGLAYAHAMLWLAEMLERADPGAELLGV
jgi:hypothetical protein